MRISHSIIVLGAVSCAVDALPKQTPDYAEYQSGFESPTVIPSVGGHAVCIQGYISVKASSMNTLLDFQDPANQTVVTNTIQEVYEAGSNITTRISKSKVKISGTYNIHSKLCFPASTGIVNPKTVQVLTHGIGFDKGYWDFYSSDYSYVDAAAQAGYTTFSYDRLGTGLSDRPDAIQIVQALLHVSILHQLVENIRAGSIANTKFSHVVGVGHSFGSDLTTVVTTMYPKDLDAVILTGYSTDGAGQPVFWSALNPAIAGYNQPTRFDNLPNGYLVSSTVLSNQFSFFRTPNFDPLVLAASEASKQTFTIGEFFTKGQLGGTVSNYTGPVMIVNGENDLAFCDGNCLFPQNQLVAALATEFPLSKKSSTSYIAPQTGHGLNLHTTAKAAYAKIFSFISTEGF